MATFYRRLQINPVIRWVNITLSDLIVTCSFSLFGWAVIDECLTLYEISFTGVALIPTGIALLIFIKICEWFRKEGDGVVKKDGRFRYLSSNKINLVLVPDAVDAEELFVVVRNIFQTNHQSWFHSLLIRLTGNVAKKRDAKVQRISGTEFCLNLKRSDK